MTLLLLIVWAILGASPAIGDPWSGWFIALLVCAVWGSIKVEYK